MVRSSFPNIDLSKTKINIEMSNIGANYISVRIRVNDVYPTRLFNPIEKVTRAEKKTVRVV